ncbi:MAG: helix-turn-helix domain-containing protein [Spirochaetes bacterium]|nr:helix-turn-helix domain-containing protein [Spirochaetota bacterium]
MNLIFFIFIVNSFFPFKTFPQEETHFPSVDRITAFPSALGLTQKQLADHISYDVKVINRIVNNKTSISAEMAVKLGSTFNQQFSVNIVQYLNKLDKVGFHTSVIGDSVIYS